MKIFKKSAILPLIFIALVFPGSLPCLGAEHLKNFGRVAGGVGLAFMAHIATEYLVLHAHEYGHVLGNKLTGGNGGTVTVKPNIHPLGLFFPFEGATRFDGLGSEVASLASGPLCGIACNYAFVTALAYLRSKWKGEAVKVPSLVKTPFTIYGEVREEIKKAITKKSTPSLLETFFITFAFLKSGKMLGEAIYGLTPISLDRGDGKRIWEELGIGGTTISIPVLFGLAALPGIIAMARGVIEGIKKSPHS